MVLKRTIASNPSVAPTVIVPPGSAHLGAAVWPAANRAVFMRFALPLGGTYRYVNWVCGVQSGNIQAGIVQLSGSGRTSYTRVAHTGIVACPAAGNIRSDLGATFLAAGDYAVFLWADNVTFQARYATNSGLTGLRISGIASSLTTGVGTSGTLAFDPAHIAISVEGDV